MDYMQRAVYMLRKTVMSVLIIPLLPASSFHTHIPLLHSDMRNENIRLKHVSVIYILKCNRQQTSFIRT